MGSSCFSGNSEMVELVKIFIKEHKLEDKVEVSGCLCRGLCKLGPNIEINGRVYNQVTPESLDEVLSEGLGVDQ